MQKLNTDMLLKPMSYIGGAVSEWRLVQQLEGYVVPPVISFEVRVGFMKAIDLLRDAAKELSMHTSLNVIETGWEDALEQIALNRPLTSHELQRLIVFGDKVASVFAAEAESQTLIAISPKHSQFIAPEKPLFGERVEEAFPTASLEIADAGRCRATGLWTACVMHLMRALEPALQALASSANVVPDQNWNSALNQIEAHLRSIRRSIEGEESEQWASEAVLQLRAIKNAWRNHAMHGRIRYGEDEAIRVFESVKFFMQILATRISE